MTLAGVRPPLLARLATLLVWADEGRGAAADAMAAHAARLEEAMGALFERVDEVVRTDRTVAPSVLLRDLASAWAGAEPDALRHVLTAPATSKRLLWLPHRPLEAARWVTAALAHEQVAASGCASIHPPRWSALGDRQLGGGCPPHAVEWRAPVIAGGIPVDWKSPLARAVHLTRDVRPGPTWPEFDEASARLATARLHEALTCLRATWVAAAELVETCTLVVVLRGPGCGFGHGATVVELGRTVFIDPLAPCATTARLAEGLLHEAVHHLCNVSVREVVWVQDAAATVPVPSPWTGNPLPLWAYLQACLVWAGLRAFWTEACARGTFEQRASRERLAVAECGFAAGPLLDHIPPTGRAGVHPLVADAITALSPP